MDAVFGAYVEALRRRRRAPVTIRDAEQVLRRLDRWLAGEGTTAADLDPLGCERYFDAQLSHYAVTTVRHQLSTVRAAYRYALRHNLAEHDPTVDVTLPRLPDVEPVTHTPDDLRAILAAVRSDREELLFFLLVFTGLRLSEAGTLLWEQIDDENNQIKLVGKAGKFRLVPLHPTLSQVLRTHRQRARPGQQHVFAGRHGRSLSNTTLNGVVLDTTSRAGLRGSATRSHTFRRTVATELYEQGVRRRVIEKIMGWAPRTTADRHYIRIADQTMQRAIRTLYQDDPITIRRSTPAAPLRLTPARSPVRFAGDLARLERLEQKYRLNSNG